MTSSKSSLLLLTETYQSISAEINIGREGCRSGSRDIRYQTRNQWCKNLHMEKIFGCFRVLSMMCWK